MELGARSFGREDQEIFAELSGDRNPIHLDAIFARRTEVALPIVHGIHAALWALECVQRLQLQPIGHLRVEFLAPIYAGDAVRAEASACGDGDTEIVLASHGDTCVRIWIGPRAKRSAPSRACSGAIVDWPKSPLVREMADIQEVSGTLHVQPDFGRIVRLFPLLSKIVCPERIAGLCAVSRIVGMVTPGLHSLLNSLDLDLTHVAPGGALAFATEKIDPKFRLVRLRVSGCGVNGLIGAFLRHPPAAQPSMSEIAGRVARNGFQGANILVVGGSRGLGEAIAKACAAGGARLHLTWVSGKEDASRVQDEIRAWGARCEILPLDVRRAIAAQLAPLPRDISHFYYCASPPLRRRRACLLAEDALTEFLELYVHGFLATSVGLRNHVVSSRLCGYFPSAAAIESPARGLTEFCMAKSAAEILCAHINATRSDMRILHSRLPRLRTDQSATVVPLRTVPLLEVVIPLVTSVQADWR